MTENNQAGESQIILVVPFHNEEQILPSFLQSLKSNPIAPEKVHVIGVNHRSSDYSEAVFEESTKGYTTTVVREGQEIASVGIPRQKGLEVALELANNSQRKTIIGSIDTDSTVSPHFLLEADSFLESDKDFLLFPTRNDQQQFLDCANIQESSQRRNLAINTLIGIDWLKYQLRALLLQAGAIETRGSGGYFFTTDGYSKAHGHKPVYSAEGTIVTGESNAVGIRAKRNGATALVSPYHNTASPRRIFKSLRNSSEGYVVEKAGKTFDVVGNNQDLPALSESEWERNYQTMLYGAIRTFAIKAVAYEVVPQLQPIVLISGFDELMETMNALYVSTPFSGDERDAIGSKTYISIFEQAFSGLGRNRQRDLSTQFNQVIPNERELVAWASSESLIIPAVTRL